MVVTETLGQEVGGHRGGWLIDEERPMAVDLVAQEGHFDGVVLGVLNMFSRLRSGDCQSPLVVGVQHDWVVVGGQELAVEDSQMNCLLHCLGKCVELGFGG